MYACLNASLTKGYLPLPEWIALAQRLDYGGVEVDLHAAYRYAQEQGSQALKSLFTTSGVKPHAFGLPVRWQGDDETFERDLSYLTRLSEVAAELGCVRCVTWLPPTVPEGKSITEHEKSIGTRFKQIACLFADYGIFFGLEWIGPAHFRRQGTPWIWTMAQMLDFERRLMEPNLGLLVDSFHWFCSEGTEEDLANLPPEKVVHVHINDAPPAPIEEQQDSRRLLPGQGIINLVSFLRGLQKAGYTEGIAIEPLGWDGLQTLAPEESARQAKEALDQVFARLA